MFMCIYAETLECIFLDKGLILSACGGWVNKLGDNGAPLCVKGFIIKMWVTVNFVWTQSQRMHALAWRRVPPMKSGIFGRTVDVCVLVCRSCDRVAPTIKRSTTHPIFLIDELRFEQEVGVSRHYHHVLELEQEEKTAASQQNLTSTSSS